MKKELSEYTPSYEYGGRIDRKITEVPDKDEDYFYCVGFRCYNERNSNIRNAKPAELRKILEFLKNVGRCKTHQEIIDNVTQEIKTVENSNHYSKYYSNLTGDVELKEFDVGNLRGFFFFEHLDKRLQLVAIDKHPEDRKQKRH